MTYRLFAAPVTMASVLVLASAAMADQPARAGGQAATAPQQQQQQQQQAAGTERSQCQQRLQQLGQQMRDEGYWLSGWRSGGYGVAGGAEPGMGAGAGPAPTAAPAPAGDATTAGGASPWGDTGWTGRPDMQLRTLYRAADVLAQRGNEEGCQAVLETTQAVYREYAAQLQEMNVRPDEITGWRQQQIVGSRPVSELGVTVRMDNVMGSELRNPQDEDLGTIDDVVLNPQSGEIRYVIVSRGGFLGFGEDRVAVPWQLLRVTPGMNTFVLPVSEQVMEDAPSLGHVADDGRDNQIERYWEQAVRR